MVTRRTFLNKSASITGLSFLPRIGYSQAPREGRETFLLTILLNGGADPTYLFDARPLSMSSPDGGVLQNYLGKEPYLWGTAGGFQTFASELTRPLRAYKDRFTVINGVHMATAFDGHDQNTNFFLSGNPFGGESFLPHLAVCSSEPKPLDYIQTDFIFAQVSNAAASIQLSVDSASGLANVTERLSGLTLDNPTLKFAKDSMDRAQARPGMFANASKRMSKSLPEVPSLLSKLSRLEIVQSENPLLSKLQMIGSFFKNGLTNNAIMIASENAFFDTHSSVSAQGQPEMFRGAVNDLAVIINYLMETPFDSTSSLYDRTIFLVATEFGRTMRQHGRPLDQTGTDHNPLTNSFIIGGGPVRGGRIIGASDFWSNNDPLDGAHLELDPSRIKMMGRAFDFDNQVPIDRNFESFDASNYLTCNSIINTVYEYFGVDKSLYRQFARNGGVARTLKGLF